MSIDTFIVRIPSADVPRELKHEIESVLAELAPLVTARIREKRQTDFKSLLEVLLRGVKLRTLDIHRAHRLAFELLHVVDVEADALHDPVGPDPANDHVRRVVRALRDIQIGDQGIEVIQGGQVRIGDRARVDCPRA